MGSGFGDMGSLLKQAQEMQKRMQDAERLLDERMIETSAGGGAVKVVMTGNLQLVSIKIEPAAVDPNDVAGLEDLVTIAVRQALDRSRAVRTQEIAKVTGGLNLPGMGF